jgi:flagellar basal-body rod modification protein FlgD
MAATAGIIHHTVTAGQALNGTALTPMDSSTAGTSGTSGSSSASSDSATISANDFLTLLVTEMQNQDPTADTDPNEYIDQLVEVNSLEQLIDINQTLSTDLGSSATSSTSGASTQAAGAAATPSAASAITAPQTAAHAARVPSLAASGAGASSAPTTQHAAVPRTSGNLSGSRVHAAAQRVAHALDGRTRARPPRGGSPATQ